jgi:hypothetical protein
MVDQCTDGKVACYDCGCRVLATTTLTCIVCHEVFCWHCFGDSTRMCPVCKADYESLEDED